MKALAAIAATKTMPNKTDRNAAKPLAQIMPSGWYRQVYVKGRQLPAVALPPGRPRRCSVTSATFARVSALLSARIFRRISSASSGTRAGEPTGAFANLHHRPVRSGLRPSQPPIAERREHG
jgi:hypothetical protein